MNDIQSWLAQLGLEKYAGLFAEHEITPDVLADLTEADLDRLALPTGPRRRLMVAIQALGVASGGMTRVAAPSAATPLAALTPAVAPAPTHLVGAPAHAATPAHPAAARTRDAERRQLTVMFCDLVGSTALSERLDPEELGELMNAYRAAVAMVVERYDGHVAQYLGDGLMVYFGWPAAHEDDAQRAARAALDIVQAVSAVNATPPLAVRIGMATGTVVVGDTLRDGKGSGPGKGNAEAGLAVGETPNLAARMQGLAAAGEIVIASAVRKLLADQFELSDLGPRALKGITEPMPVWRVDSLRRSEDRFGAAHGEAALTPLIGRSEEMAILLHRWHQARDGEGQIVLVGGEPGIGKSRLTQVLLERVAAQACTLLRYQCSPYHTHSALYPFTEALDIAAGFAREDTPEAKLDKLEALLSTSQGPANGAANGAATGAATGTVNEAANNAANKAPNETAALFAALLSLPTERYAAPKLSPQQRKEKTLEALAAHVHALARQQPVLMVFEDAHWIDPTSQEALDVLSSSLHGLPVLLMITHRPEYAPRWNQPTHLTTLGLNRLGRREATELVAKVTSGRSLPAEVLEQIVAHTDGVPLFVEELTKSVLESGLLFEAGGQLTLQTPLPAMAIPSSLRESLLARLDRLAPVKALIQIGACIGREFAHGLLARIAAIGEAELATGLQTLIEAGLVYRRGTAPEAVYTFRHALMQDAAYDSMLKSRRAQLHARIAQVLEADFPERVANEPALLAHHHTEAGNLIAAVPWWRNAGTLAAQRLGVLEAVVHFQKGLGLIQQLPPTPQRDALELSIREPLNGAWTGLRGWAAAEVSDNALAILALTKRLGQAQTAGTGLWAIWVNTTTHGRIEESLEWAERLLSEGHQADDVELQILGHGASMIAHFYLGHLLEARRHGERILALYDPQQAERWMKVTAHDLKTLVGVWACQWTWMLGYPDQAVQLSDDKDAHSRRMGDAFNLGFSLTLGGYAFDYRGEPERLLERAREVTELGQKHSLPFMSQVMVPQIEGLAHLRAGRWREAIAFLRQGLDNWQARGGHSRVPYLKSALAEALALQGDLNAALVMIDECLAQIERPGWQERSHWAEVLRLKAWMLMRQGQPEQAEPLLHAAIEWALEQQAKSWQLRASTTLAELMLADGRREAALALLAPIYGWFTEGLDTRDLKAARALLDSLR